jgi:hypothetical protein
MGGVIEVRGVEPPVMRPQPPEVWSHLVTFVRTRLAERDARPDVLWPALERFATLVAECHDPRAVAPGDSDVDTEEAMWHLASIWRDHPGFRALLEREYDRLHFAWAQRTTLPLPDREQWIREWAP